MKRIAGCDSMVGLPLQDFFDTRNLNIIQRQLKFPPKEAPTSFELELRTRDGSTRPVLITPSPRFDEQQHWAGGFLLVTDLSRIKSSEAEIRKRNEELSVLNRLAFTLNETFDLDIIVRHVLEEIRRHLRLDFVGIYLRAGETFKLRDSMGLSREVGEILRELRQELPWLTEISKNRFPVSLDEPVDWRNLDIVKAELKDIQSWTAAPLFRREDLIGVILVASKKLRSFSSEELKFLFAVANQTSVVIQNTQLFEQIYRSKVVWEKTFDSLSDLVLVYDPEGRVRNVNRALMNRLGTPFQKIIGKKSQDLFSHTSLKLDCFPTDRLEEALPIHTEVEDLERRETFLVSCTPIRDYSGGFFGMLQIARRITEEKRLREQLMQREKLSALGELVSGVAHELNNPLTGVIGFAQVLMAKPNLEPELRKDLEQIAREAERAGKIVQNLLAFARKQRSEKISMDICQLFDETLALFAYELRHSSIQVERKYDRTLPEILVDAGQLQQVFVNLINNALQAIEESNQPGILTIRSWREGGWLKIELGDNGVGISKQNLWKIFDPFFTTKSVGKGTGLGLSISFGVIQAHGGEIAVASEEGKGTQITISLPLLTKFTPQKSSPVESSYPSPKISRKILVIDDDPIILDLVEQVLVHEGHRMDLAESGKMALQRLAEDSYDLVISDIKLPGLSGIEIYKHIQAHHPELTQRVLFLTGDMLNPDTRAFLDKTGCPYLIKPFSIPDLVKAVSNLGNKN